MRFRVLFLSAVLLGAPLAAAKTVNVDQLEQQLNELRGKPDADAAYVIGDLQLSERLSPSRLEALEKLSAGRKTREALEAIADASAFLPLRAEEFPRRTEPDLAEQRRIMGLAVNYMLKALPHLPDFLATETIRHFEDTPRLVTALDTIPFEPIHFVDEQQASAAYQGGREVVQPIRTTSKSLSKEGLTSWGIFGPILSTVLLDAAHSKLGWSHWESTPDGDEAVFSYAVSRPQSHYEVNYCCVAEQGATTVADVHPFRQVVAYHGEIAVEPATGTIRRLMLTAELKPEDPISEAAILVEYEPVDIGGVTYTCPVRSISKSLAQMVQVDSVFHSPLARKIQPLKHALNETVFSDYHVFRTESRILQAQATSAGQPAASPPQSPATAATLPSAVAEVVVPAPPAASKSDAAPPVAENPPTVATAPAPSPSPEPEITQSAAAGPPDLSTGSQEDTGAIAFRSTTRLVDMTVLAFDKKGRPITDLKQEELEIFDNGRKQGLRTFEQASAEAPAATASIPAPSPSQPAEDVITNRPTDAAAAPFNTVILLIDAPNLAFGDLSYARQEMLRFLKSVPQNERIGLYVLRSYAFQVLLEPIADHARVADVLTHWMPNASDLARAQDEEQRNRQHFDWVAHDPDLASVNGNDEGNTDPSSYASGSAGAAAMAHGADPKLRKMGSDPESAALISLISVGRHLAGLPGHKTLVWVSSDNALADWSSRSTTREDKGMRFLDPLSMHARETLNESRVSLYPLDASQLEAGGVSADLQNRLVKARIESPVSLAPPPPPNPTGRMATQMHEDTRGIQPAFRELAEATGGRALRRAGDIAAELNGIVADGRAAYLVSFSPDTPADDKYHVLTAKTSRPGVTLRFRTGYLYGKEPANMKDRFRRAVWDAKDAIEIGLSAKQTATSAQLTISGSDLALAQQGGRWMDKLDIFLVTRDEQGADAKVAGQTLGLRLTPETYARVVREGIPFEQQLGNPPDGASLRIIVIDENSRRVGAITLPGMRASK